MKRQRGRNRGGGNSPGGGSGKPQQNVNRAFDSNGPDNVKIRGHAQHVFEKYQQLARDAFSSGDRVLAENYLQHADHYFRVLRTIQPNRAPAEILGRDVFASGLDIDFEDEGEGFEDAGESVEMEANGGEPRFEGRYEAGRQENGRQENGRQQDGRRDDRYESRSDRSEPRREGQDNGRFDQRRDLQETREGRVNGRRDYQEPRETRLEGREDQAPREPRSDNRRDLQDRDGRTEFRREASEGRRDQDFREPRPDTGRLDLGRPETGREGQEARREGRRSESRREREPREDRRYGVRNEADRVEDAPDPLAVIEPETAPLPFGVSRAVEADASPVLRSEDGGVSEAPAFLQASAPSGEPAEDAEVRKPRARRRRPKALDGEALGDAPAVAPVDITEEV